MKKALLLASMLWILGAAISSAATYYVDYAGGSDLNNGKSKTAPWQRCPGMQGFGGTYSHVAGDQFIFKGGVTWPNNCFTLNTGGRSGTAAKYDYYGVDQTWFAGGDWSKPHWDAQGIELANGYDVMVLLGGPQRPSSYITFDNIDFTGLYWRGAKQFSWVSYINVGYATYIAVKNCVFRNWSHGPASTTPDQLVCVMGNAQPPFNLGCVIDRCLFDGETTANQTNFQSSGAGTYQWGGRILNSTFRNMTSCVLTGQGNTVDTVVEVAYCDIGFSRNSYDPGAHDNGIEGNLGGCLNHIHDNYIHDHRSVTTLFGGHGPSDRTYFWNNLFWNNQASAIGLDIDVVAGGACFVWNNTIVGTGPPISLAHRPNGRTFGILVVRNNHFIGNDTVIFGNGISAYINDHNVRTNIGAAGYLPGNLFGPTADNSPTVDAGILPDLGYGSFHGPQMGVFTSDIVGTPRPSGLAFDAGAYEFTGPMPTSQLGNISSRASVQTGDSVLIGGFIIAGNAPKKILLRAIGPSLTQFGISTALPDPILELHKPDGSIVINDDWVSTQHPEIQATRIPPSNNREAAILATLSPGAYTAVVYGKQNATGIGIVEVYDLDSAVDSRLVNISTRGFVGRDDNVMIGGIIVGATGKILIRGIGPSLGNAGVGNPLQDPILELRNRDGSLIASNDDWKQSQETAIRATGIQPSNDKESAILSTIPPGSYTAILRGKNNATGPGLVEFYAVQ